MEKIFCMPPWKQSFIFMLYKAEKVYVVNAGSLSKMEKLKGALQRS